MKARTSLLFLATFLFLFYWSTRLPALTALPLHNDEGLHLSRAVEVWNLHPFWEIRDGKIINQFPIAFLMPQNQPDFIGRMATLFVVSIGFASGLGIARSFNKSYALLIVGALWITAPYLLFYERLAFSDAEAGAWAVTALWLARVNSKKLDLRYAVLTGLALATAILLKFTAFPVAVAIALLILTNASPRKTQIKHLAIIYFVVALCFVIPIGYLMLKGSDLFSIALGWVGGGGANSTSWLENISANLVRLGEQFTLFGNPLWTVFFGLGLFVALVLGTASQRIFTLVTLLPLFIITVFGREALSRHFVVTIPSLIVASGLGLAQLTDVLGKFRLPKIRIGWVWATAVSVVLLVGILPLLTQMQTDPANLPLPTDVRQQHITEHSSGYGLREAMAFIEETFSNDVTVVASFFGDSCRRANFYSATHQLDCGNAPGIDRIEQALTLNDMIYVLVDTAPHIGADMRPVSAQLNVEALLIEVFPRPTETVESASVQLWRLSR